MGGIGSGKMGLGKIVSTLLGLGVVYYMFISLGTGIGFLAGIPWYVLLFIILVFITWLLRQ